MAFVSLIRLLIWINYTAMFIIGQDAFRLSPFLSALPIVMFAVICGQTAIDYLEQLEEEEVRQLNQLPVARGAGEKHY